MAEQPVILVVEDEAAVRMLMLRVLTRSGYTVLTADNGIEAVKIAEQAGTIDLLVTDVIMPYIGGYQLAGILRRSRPDLRVLYISGYAREMIDEQGSIGEIHFLEKPFTPEQIVAKVTDILSSG